MIKKSAQKGFTVVEMSLAVAFLSLLLIAIVTLSMKAGSMYIKGDTNKSVNQAGRDISDALRRDFLSTDMDKITYVPDATVAPISPNDGNNEYRKSGRLCVGNVAYVWNLAGLLAPGSSPMRVKIGTAPAAPAYLVRIPNANSSICKKDGSGRYPSPVTGSSDSTDFLKATGKDFALYNFSASRVARVRSDDKRGLYHIKFTVGTFSMTAIQKSSSGYEQCRPNNDASADFDYCAINDFDMIVRVGGGVTP